MAAKAARSGGRGGAVTILLLVTLAITVLSVLSFAQSVTETATLSVARSVAFRRACRAVDSALVETLAHITESAGRPGDDLHRRLTTCPLDTGYQGTHPAARTAEELGPGGVRVEPVQVTLTRLRHYEGFGRDPYRHGILVLVARGEATVPGTDRTVEMQTTWVHEYRQGPAAPLAPFAARPLSLLRFPRAALEERAALQREARDGLLESAARVSRARAEDLADKVIGFLADYQRRIAGWRSRGKLPDPGNPRWAQIESARTDSIWAGIGVEAGTFPLEVEGAAAGGTPPGWPRLTVPGDVPVYFDWPDDGVLTSAQLRPGELEFTPLDVLPDPAGELPRGPGRPDFTASAVDWPGTQIVQQDGRTYFPPATEPAGFSLVIGPYRRFRSDAIQRLTASRDAQRDAWWIYDERAHEVPERDRLAFWGRSWPDLAAGFASQRAAFVYPDAASFSDCHPDNSVLEVFGSEHVAGEELDLSGWRSVRGPGLLSAPRIRAGPLPRDGAQPVTLVAAENLELSGVIGASIACAAGGATFREAAIRGTASLGSFDLEGCGDFRIEKEPASPGPDELARAGGIVVNVSPAPRLVVDRPGAR